MKQLIFAILLVTGVIARAEKMTPEQYIATFASTAVSEMQRSGIPASITLAQGLLESSNGNSPLATTANNHFGIKCHNEWNGDSFFMDDDEKKECFRHYTNAMQSYSDHTDFLMTRSRYAFLFEYPNTDYTNWAYGLKKAGYATNPQYPTLLITLIQKYNLANYDGQQMTYAKTTPVETVRIDEPKEIVPEIKEEPRIVADESKFNEEVIIPIEAYFGDVYMVNNIKATIVNKGDTPFGIANRYNVPLNYLYGYNDMKEGQKLIPGEYIYLQPKKVRGYAKYHQVKKGENMYDISQNFGIKLADLYEKNLMKIGEEPAAGEVVYLREINIKKPKLVTSANEPIENKIDYSSARNNELHSSNLDSKILEKTSSGATIVKASNATIADKTIQNDAGEQQSISIYTADPIEAVQKDPNEIRSVSSLISKPTIITSYEVKAGDTLYNICKRYGIEMADLMRWNHIENSSIRLGQILKLSEEVVLN